MSTFTTLTRTVIAAAAIGFAGLGLAGTAVAETPAPAQDTSVVCRSADHATDAGCATVTGVDAPHAAAKAGKGR